MTSKDLKVSVLMLVVAIILAAPSRAAAQVEVEVDPIAYGLNGFSLHVAKVLGSARVNVGTFGADIPRAFHGNAGWNATVRGVGLKLDYLGSDLDGLFVGAEGGFMRMRYTLRSAAETAKRNNIAGGVRGGYRQPIGGSGLYVVPWVGVSYGFRTEDVVVAGETFESGAWTVFPTVHIGWRF